MRFKFLTLLGIAALMGTACSETAETIPADGRHIEVIVGSSPRIGIETRTEIGEEGTSVNWLEGDKITLWATDARESAIIDAADFSLYHYNAEYSSARFTATVPAMPDGQYTYYAASPRPQHHDNTLHQATYTLPALQDGSRRLASDVMVASPVTTDALREGDNSSHVNFQFTHKVHLLKIRVAANRLGTPVERLTLRFPKAVSGDMLVDLKDPTAAPSVTDTEEGRLLTLRPAQAVDTGDVLFAVIAPTDLTEQDKIEIRAYGPKTVSQSVTFTGRHFAEGHTTPIALTIPAEEPATKIVWAMDGDGTQTIGEKITALRLLAPEGITLPDGSTEMVLTPDTQNTCELRYDRTYTTDLSGRTFTLVFETENALVRKQVTLPQITPNASHRVEVAVPMLYAEDFESVQSFDYHTNVISGFTQDGKNYAPEDLSKYGLAGGWSGTRVGAQGGKGLRIACRVNVAVIAYNYDGRVDSAPVAAIKEGRQVDLEVTFDYAADRQLAGSVKAGNPLLTLGSTNVQGPIDITKATENIVVNDMELPAEGDGKGSPLYDRLKNSMTRRIAGASNRTRLTFHITDNVGTSFNGYGVFWIYLDNIRVKIVK